MNTDRSTGVLIQRRKKSMQQLIAVQHNMMIPKTTPTAAAEPPPLANENAAKHACARNSANMKSMHTESTRT